LELTAVFESWHLGDSNYPALTKGMLVNLSFEVQIETMEVSWSESPLSLIHQGQGGYRFVARVIRLYDGDDRYTDIAVLDAGDLRFYANGPRVQELAVGRTVVATGTLMLDHYLWVEYLDRYDDPPDLFYELRVERLIEVCIPERYITRQELGMGSPASLSPEQYGPEDSVEVEAMVRGRKYPRSLEEYRPVFWIVDFSDRDVEPGVPRTFIGV
jgi:hypothetical protein